MERRLTAILAADMAGYSRLMERDAEDVLRRRARDLDTAFGPAVAKAGGRIVKTTGDGVLADMPTAAGAVEAAIAIQETIAAAEADRGDEERIAYRIGVNLGDVLVDPADQDLFGDAVNVAARLEAIAPAGGFCISDAVLQCLPNRLSAAFEDLGRQRVKNLARPVRAWRWTPEKRARGGTDGTAVADDHVRYTAAPDGVQIAYASLGEGPPLLRAPHWMNHLDYERRSAVWAPQIEALAARCRMVRFDQRGNGLSDRDPAEISEQAMIWDMDAVADAAGLGRFALLGQSQGCAFSLAYAAARPDRVRALILLNGFARGRLMRGDPEQAALHDVLTRLIQEGWGSPNPMFRQVFTASFVPDAPRAVAETFDEAQRVSVTTATALRIWSMNARIDATAAARKVRAPTLVIHCEDDRVAPIEEGRLVAQLVPGARLVTIPSRTHILLGGRPDFDRAVEEITRFVAAHA